MRTTYDILLSLEITHLYFADKVFADFELIPDAKTAELIRKLKLVSKKNSNTWRLLHQISGSRPISVESLKDKEFSFILKINSAFFYSITKETHLPDNGEMLWFNSPLDSKLIPQKRKVYPLIFNYTFHHSIRPVSFKLTTARGNELLNKTITDPVIKQENIDITSAGENIYTISEDSVPPSHLFTEEIFAKASFSNDPFYGMIYFKMVSTAGNALANHYQIQFHQKN